MIFYFVYDQNKQLINMFLFFISLPYFMLWINVPGRYPVQASNNNDETQHTNCSFERIDLVVR